MLVKMFDVSMEYSRYHVAHNDYSVDRVLCIQCVKNICTAIIARTFAYRLPHGLRIARWGMPALCVWKQY